MHALIQELEDLRALVNWKNRRVGRTKAYHMFLEKWAEIMNVVKDPNYVDKN